MVDPTTSTVVLVRARHARGGQARRVVHLAALPSGAEASSLATALCGTTLAADDVETVTPGTGVPCSRCLLCQDGAVLPPLPSVRTYQEWGWPVTVCGDQVLLAMGAEVTALVLSVGLAEAVTAILTGRDRRAPVLVNPGAPEDRVLLAGEPYGVPLPWPARVRVVTGTLPLPPSTSPFGPIRWQQRPTTPNLSGCREIDIFGAVHTTLRAATDADGEA